MKKLITITLFLMNFVSFAQQIKFNEQTLNFYQAIAFQTTFDNIIPSMQSIKLNLISTDEKSDGTQLLSFGKAEKADLHILYSSDKKIIFIKMIISNTMFMSVKIPSDLKENGFQAKGSFNNNLGQTVIVDYSNENYPYQFSVWNIGNSFDGIFLFNPEFGTLTKYEDYNTDLKLYND